MCQIGGHTELRGQKAKLSHKWKHMDKLAEEKTWEESIVQQKLFYNSSTQEQFIKNSLYYF